ncbi:jg14203, partial [Pararge aegeria aegeria]
SKSREAKVAMGGHIARRTDRRWDPKCWNGDLAPVYAALVDPPRGGRMTSSESQGAAESKRSSMRV